MPDANPTTRRPRFSLRTLLLATTFIVMALVIVMLARELFPLRAEVQRLRDEAGYLTIDDPTKVHAIQVETESPLVWKWKVWIPEGIPNIQLGAMAGEIPADGDFNKLRGGIGGQALAGKELTITTRVFQDLNGDWKLGAGMGGAVSYQILTPAQVAMLRDSSGSSWRQVGRATETWDGKEPFILLRRRIAPKDAPFVDGGILDTEGPGVLVWLRIDDGS